ncbi:MAG: hypothetical protein IPJ65_00110 [Archangiaceae bacterium]|nr:hypothetical protein [Archangiaceae bacterium]
MLSALMVAVMLAAQDGPPEADAPAEVPLVPAPVEPPAPPAPADEAQVTLEREEHQRVVRIGATALGGAVGIALPLVIGYGWRQAQGPCTFTCDAPLAVMAGFVPLTLGLGLGVGHTVTHGRAGVGFGLAGALAGYTFSSGLLAMVSVATNTQWTTNSAAAGGFGFLAAMSLLGGVGAMELRHSELLAGAQPWPAGRAFAEGFAMWIPAGLTELATVWLLVSGVFGQGPIGYFGIALGSLLSLGGGSAVAWGVHRAMHGKGSYWSAVLGTLASAALAGLFLMPHFVGPPIGGLSAGGGTTFIVTIPLLASIIATMGTSAGLEWSSALNSGARDPTRLDVDSERDAGDGTPLPSLQAGFTPNGGFSLGFSGRF